MKKTVNIFLIVFLISFQLKSFAGEKNYHKELITDWSRICLLYTSPSPRDGTSSRMPSSA